MKSFAQLICKTPLAYESEFPVCTKDSRFVADPQFAQLLTNTASCSPYLRSIIEKNLPWVATLAEANPEAICQEFCQPFLIESSVQVADELRKRKKKIALLIALADLGGVWTLNQVTETLTQFADFACGILLKSLVNEAANKGKIKAISDGQQTSFGGLFILAMGKMGGKELNYSSDIDLVVLFDETKHDLDQFNLVKSEFVKITRKFTRLMSETTKEGYVFRTDLRLRPDPFVNPVCLSVGGAERYYESFARAWERAAYIKARPCAGDIAAGYEFLQRINPFIWRLQYDFTALQDTSEMQDRIWENVGSTDINNLFGYNLKLGRGGIREIELFVQTYQMVAGGRDQSLRIKDTMGALNCLVKKGWVDKETAYGLKVNYTKLRTWEHRVQMIRDAQTHQLPKTTQEMQRLAALCGLGSSDELVKAVRAALMVVQENTGKNSDQPEAAVETSDYSFMSEAERNLVEQWRHLPAFRTDRANQIFNRLRPQLFNRIARSGNPREALIQFDSFLRGLPAGVQLFSLFEANPQLMELLTDICATAPKLAQFLSRNSRVLDAVLEANFFEPLPAMNSLKKELTQLLSGLTDYEWTLRQARRWMHEKHFKIGTHHLKSMLNPKEIAISYASLADAVITSITPHVVEQFSKLYGLPPGRGFTILAMGSLGSQNLTSKSDLDIILIYDPLDEDYSKGKKPLSSRQYYARLTQALVSALSSRLPEGQLYEIDMRLRPSGRKGPVATSLKSFKYYQLTDAWVWEHLALTRARTIAGNDELAQEIEEFRQDLISRPHDQQKIVDSVIDMRNRLAKNAPVNTEKNVWELRSGEARILDIELIAQAGALLSGSKQRRVDEQCNAGYQIGWMTPTERDCLKETYAQLGTIKQAICLTVEGEFNPENAGTGVKEFLLTQTGFNSLEELGNCLSENRNIARKAINRILSRTCG